MLPRRDSAGAGPPYAGRVFDELRPVEAPLGWRRIAIDGAVALLAAAFTLIMLQEGGLGAAQSGFRPLDVLGVVLALVSTLPLLFPRRCPEVAFGLSGAATLALIALNYAVDVPPGALVATFVLADTVDGESVLRRRLGLAVVAAFVPLSIGLMVLNDLKVQGMSSGFAAWAAMFALVWLAGDRNRLRRERITELVVTARLRDLDLQGQRRLAAAEERTRIARELHDSAGHAINVILVQAGAARLLHDRDPERSRRAIETIEEVAQATIADIDRLVRALRHGSGQADPAPADTEALEQLVDRHRASGLDVSATFHGAPRGLPSGVAWAAYRILQEALTNAARHGSGSADVRMSYGPSAVDIEVSNPVDTESRPGGGAPARSGTTPTGPTSMPADSSSTPAGRSTTSDGGDHHNTPVREDRREVREDWLRREEDWRGREEDWRGQGESRPGNGLGIVGMRERAALLDGSLQADTLDSADGEIFRLRARLPYVAPVAAGVHT